MEDFLYQIGLIIPAIDWTPKGIFTAFGLFWVLIVTPVAFYWVVLRGHVRFRPEGYVGRFRRPDGTEVHINRVEGQLMVISEEQPGVMPRDLSNVTGRELARWHKLSSTPDGQDCVTRPD